MTYRGTQACTRHAQRGVSLVEVAIVLVIIGLLIGSILKGQEMINSARVRDLADVASEVQTAYFGFFDRYQQVPGDWQPAQASNGIGATIVGGGNGDGALGHDPDVWAEPNAMWEQLTAAGFIKGDFDGGLEEPDTTNNNAALNAYNGVISAARSADYEAAVSPRLHVVLGRRVPAKVYGELDTKLDDGNPDSGDVRATLETATVLSGTNNWGGSDANCVVAATGTEPARWDAATDGQDCNAIVLF